jgi:hypothetical protein
MGDLSLDAVWSRYQRAKQRRRCWENLWRECYTYALPQRGTGFGSEFRPGGIRSSGCSMAPPWTERSSSVRRYSPS